MKMEKIKIGDVVYNSSGTSEATVKSFYYASSPEKLATLEYNKSGMMVHDVKVSKLSLVNKTDTHYYQGLKVHILFESGGYTVIKLPDSNIPSVVKNSDVTKEAPYIVAIKFADTHKIYNYFCEEGVLSAGDTIQVKGGSNLARVVAVGVKSNLATTWLKGDIIKRTPFG
jgi:hypothetical protein